MAHHKARRKQLSWMRASVMVEWTVVPMVVVIGSMLIL
jgi:hypothetical protein